MRQDPGNRASVNHGISRWPTAISTHSSRMAWAYVWAEERTAGRTVGLHEEVAALGPGFPLAGVRHREESCSGRWTRRQQ
ncbi:hypothetical protein NDU88_004547 [Pleurodeles waltl]|uniref:Uncharacterized protein n=1 Tax=Pleurodeles waltl TaxID=8319 RepID=A0AAV7M7T2_PLEWA|nr:hypothetical protein NDU88_004547 [Pleurodeles waltl]